MVETAEHFTRDSNGDGRIGSWGLNPTTGRVIVMLIRCFSGYDYDMINAEGTKAMVNAPKTKEGLRWVTDLYQKYEVTPTPQAMETGFNQLFMSGRCAMYQTGCWGGPGLSNAMKAKGDFPVTWWLTSLPTGPSGVLGSHAEVDCECVLSQSEHKEAAFELITYFVTKEAGVLLGLNFGCAGARADQYEDDRLRGRHFTIVEDKTDADLFAIYNRINENAGPYFYPANLHGQEAFQVYGQALTPLWVGKEEPTDGFFDKVNEQLQTVLDKPKAGGE
jgi:ABC-type glycerol-3-phosphate transport system substrate-binding protein